MTRALLFALPLFISCQDAAIVPPAPAPKGQGGAVGGATADDDKASADDDKKADAETSGGAVHVIDQALDDDARTLFWHLPQGSYIVPYDWFLALQDAEGTFLVDRLESMGYIGSWYDAALNPDILPIGFTIENPTERDTRVFGLAGRWLGINCAACHVGAIEHDGKQIVIDGGPALADLQALNLSLVRDLRSTLDDEARLSSFVARLGEEPTAANIARVEQEIASYLDTFNTFIKNSFHDDDGNELHPGPGRVDAFGVILNQVAAVALGVPENRRTPNAPVRYPFVWDSPDLSWVQYNGLVQNPFTRNIGEVLGVYGRLQLDPDRPDYLASTVRYEELQQIESTLRLLEPPTWTEVFGSAPEKSARGEELYAALCDSCHPRVPGRVTGDGREVPPVPEGEQPPPGTFERVELFPWQEIATDNQFLLNLGARATSDIGAFAGSSPLAKAELADLPFVTKELETRFLAGLGQVPPLQKTDNAATLLGMTTITLALQYYRDAAVAIGSPRYLDITNFANPAAKAPNPTGYKARSLRGIFATGPYLHNGSVRTLRDLLRPEDQREPSFRIGSYRFDAASVGYVSAGPSEFDTTKLGNSNHGHSGARFGTHLDDDDADALVQYLKSL